MEQDQRYIYQVYRDGSFSAAAEHLYMSQPALSIAVRRVEAALGAELFDRSRRPVALTEAGEAYIEALRGIRSLEEDLERRIEDLRGLQTGTLRLGGTHFINSCILAPILSEFSRCYPGIRLSLFEDSAARLQGMLERRELDLTFSCAPEIVEQFEHRRAFFDHVLLAVPGTIDLSPELEAQALRAGDILRRRHRAPEAKRSALEPFRELDFILLQEGNNLYQRSRCLFAEAGFTPRVKLSLGQMVTAWHLAECGLGATFLSDRLIRSEDSSLRFFALASPQADRLFHFLLPKRDYTPFAVRRFLDFAAARIPHPGF